MASRRRWEGDERDAWKRCALLLAAWNGHLEVVRWLVWEGGSSVEERDNHGGTALLWAAANGHLEVVRWLVQEGGSSVEERDLEGRTVLHFAARTGRLNVVRWLVREGGSSVEDKCSGREMTALLCAAENSHFEVMRWLLSEGGSTIDESMFGGVTIWGLIEKWNNSDKEGKDDSVEEEDAIDEEAANACLCTCLTVGVLPVGFDATIHLNTAQQELVYKAATVRTRRLGWLERRRSLVQWGLVCLPWTLVSVVLEYCEPNVEDMWDEAAGIPLDDFWEVHDSCTKLREENARLHEQIRKLQETTTCLHGGPQGRKRAQDRTQGGRRSGAKRGRSR